MGNKPSNTLKELGESAEQSPGISGPPPRVYNPSEMKHFEVPQVPKDDQGFVRAFEVDQVKELKE